MVNFNRQLGATMASLGRPKLDVMRELALSINPHLEIQAFPEGVTEDNLDVFLRGADVVVDSLDFFAFAIRRRLFMHAWDLGIPVVTAGPLGFGAALLVFSAPGMSFDEYFDIHDGLTEEELLLRFAMGLSPRGLHFCYIDRQRVSLRRRRGPSSYIACQACASVASMEGVRLVLGRPGTRPAPAYLQFDPYLTKFCAGRLMWGNRNPSQRLKGSGSALGHPKNPTARWWCPCPRPRLATSCRRPLPRPRATMPSPGASRGWMMAWGCE